MDPWALNDRNEPLQYRQGLAVSVLLHAMAVSVAVALVADLHLVPQPDLFKWDVAMVEAPPPHDNPTHASAPASVPTHAEPASAPPPRAAPRQIQKTIETQSIMHTAQPVHQPVRQKVIHTRPPVLTGTEATHQSTEDTSRTTQAIQTVVAQTPDRPVQSAFAPVDHATSIEKDMAVLSTPPEATAVTKPIMTEATSLSSSEPAVVSRSSAETTQTSPAVQQRLVNKAAPTITESTTVVERAKAVEGPVTEPSSRRALPVRSTPSIQEADTRTAQPLIEQAKIPGPLSNESSAVRELLPRSRAAVKADFGWLTRALLTRIDQLKRYPQAARLNHWEGKVVLRAVIREDGQLIGIEVAESSGYLELDQDALDIIRKASPLELAHPLGQSQVIVRVPIRYRLE